MSIINIDSTTTQNLGDMRDIVNNNFNHIRGLEVVNGKGFYNGVQLYGLEDLWFVGDVNYPISEGYSSSGSGERGGKIFYNNINNKGDVLLKFNFNHQSSVNYSVSWKGELLKIGSDTYQSVYSGSGSSSINSPISKEIFINNLDAGDKIRLTFSGSYLFINNLQYFAGNNPNAIRIGGF